MITAPAHRVKVGMAGDCQVIKRTVAGRIIDIVIIAVVIVVVIKWPLRCIDFCGCGMHKYASSNSDNRWIYWVNTLRPSPHDSHTCVVSTSHLLYRETMVCNVRGVLQLKDVAADFAVTAN